jgi:hypothetical protein
MGRMRAGGRVLVVCVAATLGACGGSHARVASHAPTSAAPLPVKVTLSGSSLLAAGGAPPPPAPSTPPALTDPVQAAVLRTVDAYVHDAIEAPLRTGLPATTVAQWFSAEAAPRLAGADRAALVDEGTPPATSLSTRQATVQLTALAGPDGSVVAVSAALDIELDVRTAESAPFTVAHTGELVLVPEGGQWRIDGYDVRMTRTAANGQTSTSVASAVRR